MAVSRTLGDLAKPPLQMFDGILPDDIQAEEIYRVTGEFRRRKLEIKLGYDGSIIDLLTAGDEADLSQRLADSPHLLEAQMTYEHEMVHWYQQIGTAYGYLQLEVDDCAARHVSTFFEKFRASHPKAPFPHPLQSWVFRQPRPLL